MILNNEQPITVPAVEQKQFPHLWLKNIHISSNSPKEGMIMITASPYNATTKEVGQGTIKSIMIRDLWAAIENVPEAALAMQAIIAAIEPLEEWFKIQDAESIISE